MSLDRSESASPPTPDTPDPIDTLFEELEREVAGERPDAGDGQDADDATIAELVERVEEATEDSIGEEQRPDSSEEVTSVSPDEFPDAGSRDDESVLTGIEDRAPEAAQSSSTPTETTPRSQDLTARELFANLNDETRDED
jgi:hypothetical protein